MPLLSWKWFTLSEMIRTFLYQFFYLKQRFFFLLYFSYHFKEISEWLHGINPIYTHNKTEVQGYKTSHRTTVDPRTHGFDLGRSTYTWTFFSSKYFSTIRSMAGWIHVWGTEDTEEPHLWRADCKLYMDFWQHKWLCPSPLYCLRVNCSSRTKMNLVLPESKA